MMRPLDVDVIAAAGGSADAYARLVNHCRGLVASIALAIVRDVRSSEDVAQDVFVRAYSALPKLRNPNSFLPWLRQLARNRSHAFLAERGRLPEPVSDELLAAAADPTPLADARLMRAEELRILDEALEALPDEAREILLLYYREGRSVAQVAELLGLREATTKKRLSRARARLREDLEERFGRVAESTCPNNDFTAAVIVALPNLASVVAGGGAALKAVGIAAKPLAVAAPGLLGGLFGVGSGLRNNLRLARNTHERRVLWTARLVMAAAVIVFGLAVPHVRQMPHPRISLVALTAMLMFAVDICALVESRVLAQQRHAAQSQMSAVERTRRRKRVVVITIFGHVLGWLPAIWFLLQ